MAAIFLHTTDALAQDCTCVTPARPDGVAGAFLSAKGEVLTTGDNNYVQAVAGSPIVVGSEISVGANSNASIAVGQTCRLALDANTLTRVARTDGNLCVAVKPASIAAAPIQPAATLPIAPLAIGGALIGGVVLLALGQGDDPVSQ